MSASTSGALAAKPDEVDIVGGYLAIASANKPESTAKNEARVHFQMQQTFPTRVALASRQGGYSDAPSDPLRPLDAGEFVAARRTPTSVDLVRPIFALSPGQEFGFSSETL